MYKDVKLYVWHTKDVCVCVHDERKEDNYGAQNELEKYPNLSLLTRTHIHIMYLYFCLCIVNNNNRVYMKINIL